MSTLRAKVPDAFREGLAGCRLEEVAVPANVVLLFVRRPKAGATKTRLAAVIGARQAATLYRAMVEDVVEHLRSPRYDLIIVSSPPASNAAVHRWLGQKTWPQQGDDLGERMRAAIVRALNQGYDKVLLIGSDIPHFSPAWIEYAFDVLDSVDVVLGPCEDGGYYLIGMRASHDVFAGVAWSTPRVLDDTVQRVRSLGLQVGFTVSTFDVDTVADLKRLREVESCLGPRTAAALSSVILR